jgi:hypothetical protein
MAEATRVKQKEWDACPGRNHCFGRINSLFRRIADDLGGVCDTAGVTGKGILGMLVCATAFAAPQQSGLDFAKDGSLHFPHDYRTWVYLTSGFDMSYRPGMQMGDEHIFDNVFVNPEAYRVFQATGTWPDKTMLVLEERNARAKGSINQTGNFQGGVAGVEVHVKD